MSSRSIGPVDPAAKVAEVLDRLAAGQAVVQRELARDVADPAMDRDRVLRGLDLEHEGAAGCRADQVEQGPDRRGLAGAVGPEEAEDLALGDVEVDIDDAAVHPVRLGELLRADDRRHSAWSFLPVRPARCSR
jgi:hypothetical protein